MRRSLTIMTMTLMALALAAVPTLAGGGLHAGGGGGGLCRGFADGDVVELDDNCFDGTGHRLDAGATLTIRNRGQLPHTYTALDGSFDTGTLQPGEETELILTEPGVLPVRCTLHSDASGNGMSGLLVVEDNDVPMDMAAAEEEPAASRAWAWWLAGVAAVAGATGLAGRLVAARR